MKNFLLGFVALTIATAPAIAQEVTSQKAVAVPSIKKVEVNQDGSLTGMVYAKVASEETPVEAKVTLLSSNGVVIEAVQTENGSFSFANIDPGSYILSGTAAGFAGAQTYEVGPYTGAAGAASSSNLDLQRTGNAVHQGSAVYDTPVCATTTCGTGGTVSSSGGFGGGGQVGGGFGKRNLLLGAGLVGGIIAIAVDDDDVSADQ